MALRQGMQWIRFLHAGDCFKGYWGLKFQQGYAHRMPYFGVVIEGLNDRAVSRDVVDRIFYPGICVLVPRRLGQYRGMKQPLD